MKILIVDDDKDIVELLSIYVENEGYEVEKAYNGKEALSKLNMNPDITLMILDVILFLPHELLPSHPFVASSHLRSSM